ncbi:hypothetical protein G9U51_04065 [Calidifontibacter sp. DB0510]|uniref:Transmembrane protein n=1 Tax=Metallococcus carri TaxID=1656884 RepID=A0A967EDQ6_9MICO|nr:hypothetical protein [Metallococcus carri]NHN54961.1 hypothetical protein [Metallococcus carri]NOP37307.1 hypothetical protein [Calidifontibacter sp. DB2511S]
MPSHDDKTRSVLQLRTGTKICILIGLALLVLAVYFYLVPMSLRTTSGGVFECGSASSPPSEQFAKNVCQNLTDENKYKAFAAGLIGLLTLALGTWFFGVDKATQERRARPGWDDEDDEPRGRGRRDWDDEHDADGFDDHDDDLDESAARPARGASALGSAKRRPPRSESRWERVEDEADDPRATSGRPSRRRSYDD